MLNILLCKRVFPVCTLLSITEVLNSHLGAAVRYVSEEDLSRIDGYEQTISDLGGCSNAGNSLISTRPARPPGYSIIGYSYSILPPLYQHNQV